MIPSLRVFVLPILIYYNAEHAIVLLLQTLDILHRQARLAHMDLTSSNIMGLGSADPWDDIRLIDFGLAEKCVPCMSSLRSPETPCPEL